MSTAIKKPIFIVGSGRSGTTILYNLLSTHPQSCWLSNYSDRFPKFKLMPLLHRTLDLPFLGKMLKKNIISSQNFSLKPEEGGRIYRKYCGFKDSVKTTEQDWNSKIENKFKEVIERHLALSHKKRFLNKQTANNQRIRLINYMFKDAYYIHMIRDGRAVANSLFNVRWWYDTDIWWLGKKPSEWKEEGREDLELCGLHWKHDVEEIMKNKALFENRYIEIRYEEFVADVWGTMNRIIDFCELSKSKKFLDILPQTLPNMNYKWKKNLTKNQKEILDKTIKTYLKLLGYD